jgi:hypothetical protein
MQIAASTLFPLFACLVGIRILRDKIKIRIQLLLPFALILTVSSICFSFSAAEILFFSAFLVGVITDAHSGEVYDYSLYAMAPSALYLFYGTRSYIAAIFMLLIPFYKGNKKLQFYFGEGDLWILLFISMAYGRNVFYTLFYASCLGLLFSFVRKKREVYFLPFLFLGLLISQVEKINNIFGI